MANFKVHARNLISLFILRRRTDVRCAIIMFHVSCMIHKCLRFVFVIFGQTKDTKQKKNENLKKRMNLFEKLNAKQEKIKKKEKKNAKSFGAFYLCLRTTPKMGMN